MITAATLKLYPQPAAQITAMAAVEDPRAALRLLGMAQSMLGASLTAFELMSNLCMELVLQHFPDNRQPFAQPSPYYVLLETSDNEGEGHARAIFEALMEHAIEAGVVLDAAVSASGPQSRALWALRESISEAQALSGKNIKHDVSVPISSIADFVEQADAQLTQHFSGVRVVVFGHLGDGNLPYNVSPRRSQRAARRGEFLAMQLRSTGSPTTWRSPSVARSPQNTAWSSCAATRPRATSRRLRWADAPGEQALDPLGS